MAKTEQTIRVAEYSKTPGGRYAAHGPFPGDQWRDEYLRPAVETALQANMKLRVDLDGTAGLASSFLEEAFGGLVRKYGYDVNKLVDLLVLKSDREPYLIDDVREFMRDAAAVAR